jgi:hypothetical protein
MYITGKFNSTRSQVNVSSVHGDRASATHSATGTALNVIEVTWAPFSDQRRRPVRGDVLAYFDRDDVVLAPKR